MKESTEGNIFKTMEISDALQDEVADMQNQLGLAIRDHHMCLLHLRNDPSNTILANKLAEIQRSIISISKWQKEIIKQLQNEVQEYKEKFAKDNKFTVAPIRGTNNNNHIINNNEVRRRKSTIEIRKINGYIETTTYKEDLEDEIRSNVDSLITKTLSDDQRSSPAESTSSEDDVIELPIDHSPISSDNDEQEPACYTQESFCLLFGLITNEKFKEMQNRRKERKRRSTANPNYIWDKPKRKKQDEKNQTAKPPRTRKSVTKSNEPPSPTMTDNEKACNSSNKSPLLKKSIIQKPKISAKPINNFKSASEDVSQLQIKKSKINSGRSLLIKKQNLNPDFGKKSSKIGLPSSISIERIDNRSSVCITCKEPGALRVCQNCSANFHFSCHISTSASKWNCPKCVQNGKKKSSISITSTKGETEGNKKLSTKSSAKKMMEVYQLHKMEAKKANDSARFVNTSNGLIQIPVQTSVIPIENNTSKNSEDDYPLILNDYAHNNRFIPIAPRLSGFYDSVSEKSKNKPGPSYILIDSGNVENNLNLITPPASEIRNIETSNLIKKQSKIAAKRQNYKSLIKASNLRKNKEDMKKTMKEQKLPEVHDIIDLESPPRLEPEVDYSENNPENFQKTLDNKHILAAKNYEYLKANNIHLEIIPTLKDNSKKSLPEDILILTKPELSEISISSKTKDSQKFNEMSLLQTNIVTQAEENIVCENNDHFDSKIVENIGSIKISDSNDFEVLEIPQEDVKKLKQQIQEDLNAEILELEKIVNSSESDFVNQDVSQIKIEKVVSGYTEICKELDAKSSINNSEDFSLVY